MTLIMSYQRNDFVVMLGDLMLSRQTPLDSAIELPTRDRRFPLSNLHLAGLQQKVFCINPRLAVAWAGTQVVARYIIGKIASELREPYSGQQVLDFIAALELPEKEKNSVSFIFFLVTGFEGERTDIQVQDYLTKEYVMPDNSREKYKFAGSGDFHFFETIAFNAKVIGVSGPVDERIVALALVIGRAAIALYEELVSDTPHNFFYGGGFEVLAPNLGDFIKLPLTFAFWVYRGPEIELVGPVFVQEYNQAGMLGLHSFIRQGEQWEQTIFEVSNFLAQGKGQFSPQSSPKTMWSVHYFINAEDPSSDITILQKYGAQANLQVNIENGNVVTTVLPSFERELASAISST